MLLWILWRQPQPTPPSLARYSSQEALIFIEASSLPAGLRRLEDLSFWKDIKSAIGTPRQFDDVLQASKLIEWFDIGPTEARLLAHTRWGLVVTGMTAEITPSPAADPSKPIGSKSNKSAAPPPSDGAILDLTPQVTLCLATGLSPEELTRITRERIPLVARKLFGQDPQRSEHTHAGGQITSFHHPVRPEAVLWAASRGNLLFLANHEASLRSCLEVADGQRPSLADLPSFEGTRQAVSGQQSWLFAFVNPSGLEAVLRLKQGIPGTDSTVSDGGQEQPLLTALLSGLSNGLGYSLDIQDGQVVDRYHLTLHPNIVATLRQHLRPALVPHHVERFLSPTGGVTVVGLAQPLTALDQIQIALAARSSAPVAFLSRELVAGLRERYGIRPKEALDDALGEQWLAIDPGHGTPSSLILGVPVRDRTRLLPPLNRYLQADGYDLTTLSLGATNITLAASTHRDGRAAGFLDDRLFLGNRSALEQVLSRAADRLLPPVAPPTWHGAPEAFLRCVNQPRNDLKRATLALIALTRAGEATPSRLDEPAIRQAIERQPPATGYLQLRDDGCFGEMRSPLGNLAYLTSLFEVR
ncbi:MAG: hypothetical protein ACUVR8_11460 [Acidobacteriota bacterium]